ncbi:MAG: DUF3047 domain-containing protein [Candidatus Omnitrophica bacterium]|nr:DUF3047 domain-containing protein [Candidatus Omnitrophota bacterium]MBU4346518.1 DUF3047 domain-containing protein [Candidatus Omnitrophota bacterium]MBU4473500.1 DUF3047 domain-containing protein [Candidatus Omnitrophota bacterium]MCG2706787.1 DUF3047 domain-containing protein [Candidatus Omnitrophota bacterium]
MKVMRSFKKFSILFFALSILIACVVSLTLGFNLPKWFPFTTERSLNEWQDKIFKGKVVYKIEHSGPQGYLHALSIGSASAIFYRIRGRFNTEDYPMISWKWKVIRFPDKKKLKMRQGIESDDYAARVYVIFPSINFLVSKALEYVWDESLPEGTISESPYSKNIRLMVVQTGRDKLDSWIFEERNIFQDYRKAFGRNPSVKIGAIALMSDADNSQDISEAYFDEIKIGYKKER